MRNRKPSASTIRRNRNARNKLIGNIAMGFGYCAAALMVGGCLVFSALATNGII